MSHDDLAPRPAQPATEPLARTAPPASPPSTSPATPPTTGEQTPAGPAARRGPRRAWWIAGGAAAGLVLLGGGIGIGALIADEDDDDVVVVQGSDAGQPAGSGAEGAGDRAGDDDQPARADAGTVRVDPDDIELTGDVLESATAAALAAAGDEGVVTGAERSDDATHVYEVEVTRADGTQMDVYLDDAFGVVATETWHRD